MNYDRFRPSVCLPVCHSLVSCQNDQVMIMRSSPEDSLVNFTAKFQGNIGSGDRTSWYLY